MPDSVTHIKRLDQRPLREAISSRGRSFIPGLTKDELIKFFFGANAWVAIVVLGLIMLSLYSESIGFDPANGFFGQNYRNLLRYRQAGLEFVDIVKKETGDIDDLGKVLADVRLQELKRQIAAGQAAGKPQDQAIQDANAALAPLDAYAAQLSGLEDPLNNIISPLEDTVTATRDSMIDLENHQSALRLYLSKGRKDLADQEQSKIHPIDLAAAVQPLHDAIPSIRDAHSFPPRWPPSPPRPRPRSTGK
jgi:phosphate transport system permease protein